VRRRLLSVLTAGALTVAGVVAAQAIGHRHPSHQLTASNAGASRASTASPSPTPAMPSSLHVVALGDSVPAGTACACRPFPTVYAQRLRAQTQLPVDVRNLGTPGQTSGLLRQALMHSTAFEHAVASANVITTTIGANDLTPQAYQDGSCPDLRCYDATLQQLRANLDATFDRIEQLRDRQPTVVLVTGYWDIWKDGAVARSFGSRYVQVGDTLTDRVNRLLAAAAQRDAFQYVDLVVPFRGASRDDDDTDLLAPDGDHPNSGGHDLIAATLMRSGLLPLLGD